MVIEISLHGFAFLVENNKATLLFEARYKVFVGINTVFINACIPRSKLSGMKKMSSAHNMEEAKETLSTPGKGWWAYQEQKVKLS